MSEITKVTDKEAVDALKKNSISQIRFANKFVPRTILYAVKIEYGPGKENIETRTFVRQGEFCSERQWELALEMEKKFAQLNKLYTDELKKAGRPVNKKGSDNPLNATPINIQ